VKDGCPKRDDCFHPPGLHSRVRALPANKRTKEIIGFRPQKHSWVRTLGSSVSVVVQKWSQMLLAISMEEKESDRMDGFFIFYLFFYFFMFFPVSPAKGCR